MFIRVKSLSNFTFHLKNKQVNMLINIKFVADPARVTIAYS